MASPDAGPARPRHDPFAALRQRNFQLFLTSRLFSATAMTLLNSVIALQVFRLTGSPAQLGMLGLVRFVPALGLSLVGGAVADSHDRKRIVMLAQVAPLVASVTLLAATVNDAVEMPLIYALVLLTALAAAFENPARQALVPSVVSRETFANAITVNSTFQSLAFVTGPAVGGVMVGWGGFDAAYLLHIGLIASSLFVLLWLRPRAPEGERRAVSLAAIREGVSFVWHRQVLLGAMTLDMFAVVFGGATALLPVYALEILEVGPRGYGVLAASLEAGALLMAIVLVFIPPIRNAGRALLISIAMFGIGTIVFGLSRSFPLSVATYMAIGMADQISVVLRQTTVQLSTPDELRGRVSSVNMLFIGASNQLGAVESGFVAAVTSATFAVVSGGIGCLAVVGAVALGMPELRRYRLEPRVAVAPGEANAATPAGAKAAGPGP